MPQKLVFLTLLCCLGTTLTAQSSEGTDFWLTFLEHRDVNNQRVALITAREPTTGIITIPQLGFSVDFSVGASAITQVELPAGSETLGSGQVRPAGVHVTSTSPISLYMHQYFANRSEASLVLPTNTLGTDYYALAYQGVTIQELTYSSELAVVATQNATTVTIVPAAATLSGQAAGLPITVVLDRGQTYQLQAATAAGDLTGSRITADRPIAVFAGNSWTEVPVSCGPRDNLVEQMYPVDTWGKQFVTVPSRGNDFDVFRIIAAENGTAVTVTGAEATLNYTLSAGQFAEYQRSQATYVSANRPVLVAQYLVGQSCSGHPIGDPSMLLLNSVEQTRDTVTVFNSGLFAITENYINLIGRTVDFDFITLDGQALANQDIVQGTVGPGGEFFHAGIRVGAGSHTISGGGGCGVIATVYGYGIAESYAYGGGASFRSINANPIPAGGCLGDTIVFDTGLDTLRYNFQWTLEDGSIRTEPSFERAYPALGSYPIQLIIEDECLGTIDTNNRDLLITLRQAVSVGPDVTVCAGDTVRLSATDLPGASYEWRGPAGFFSEEQNPRLFGVQPPQTGDYTAIGIITGCATFPAVTRIEINEPPRPDLGRDTFFCPRETDGPTLQAGTFAGYQWQDGRTTATYPLTSGGTYRLTVTDATGCPGADSVTVAEICPTRVYVPTAFSPNDDGINDTFTAFILDHTAYRLTVYDRWGGQLFVSDEPDLAWNGRARGRNVPAGAYLWELAYAGFGADGLPFSTIRSGSVTLMR